MSKRKRLERIEQAVAERVAELKSELDTDPGEPERQRKKRALQAAQQRAQRVERARQKLAELEQEKAARAKTHAIEEANKGEPKVSVSDPEIRSMRLADGAVAPAWNACRARFLRCRSGSPGAVSSSLFNSATRLAMTIGVGSAT